MHFVIFLLLVIIALMIFGRDGIGAIVVVLFIMYLVGAILPDKPKEVTDPTCISYDKNGWCDHHQGDVYTDFDNKWHTPLNPN